MNETEKNIQKLLVENRQEHILNSALEDHVMDTIAAENDYVFLLNKTKKKAKIGILISLFLLVIYIVKVYVELYFSTRYSESNLSAFYPTIFTTIVVCLLYFEMMLGTDVFRKKEINNLQE